MLKLLLLKMSEKMLVNLHIKQMYENHYCVLLLSAKWGKDVGKLVRAYQRLSWTDIKSLRKHL